jgi:predicted phage terminase large subunit-like protein
MTQALTDPLTSWRAWPVGYGEHLGEGLWHSEPVHELFAAALMRTVLGDGSRRLIINVPPRHGKTEGISRWGSVWYLDWFPHQRVALAMYAAELAGEIGASVRDTLREHPDDLDVRVRRDSSARNRWNTTKRGGFIATGVGGILTGRGGSLLLCDDPIKNWEEANSQVYRRKMIDWWRSTWRTRLEPGPDGGDGAMVVVQTRWHEDDLTGWLVREQGLVADGGIWNQISIPAIAEPNDPLGRAEGEALSDRYPIDALLATRAELGEFIFDALYQQHPSAPLGRVFHREWWRHSDAWPRLDADQWLGSIDCTFKDTDESDYVALQVYCRKGAEKWLVDAWRRQASFVTTCEALEAMARRWPQVNQWVVEDKANGPAVISQLRNRVHGVVGYTPPDSKLARAIAASPTVKAGQVYLPAHAKFEPLLPDDDPRLPLTVEDFVDELAAFPTGTHDDQVDAFSQAMLHLGVHMPIIGQGGDRYRDERLEGRGR